jgi:hypothetical protein
MNREIRREQTRLRVIRHREKQECNAISVTSALQSVTAASASSSVLKEGVRGRFQDWVKVCKAMRNKPKNWESMFHEQAEWLQKFSESDQIEILSQSIRNNWQGLFPPKRDKKPWKRKETRSNQSRLDREYAEAQQRKLEENVQTRQQTTDTITDLCEQAGCSEKIAKIHLRQYGHSRWNPHPPQAFINWWGNGGIEATENKTGRGWRAIDAARAFNCEAVRETYSEAKETSERHEQPAPASNVLV